MLNSFFLIIILIVMFFLNDGLIFNVITFIASASLLYFFVSLPMFRAEEGKGLLTERILELLGVKNIDDINLTKHSYVDEDQVITKSWVIEYQNAFKENNPYPKDYFDKKKDQT